MSAEYANTELVVTGYAYAVNSDALLYIEHHYTDTASETWRVAYMYPDGRLIADKSVDFRAGDFTPAFELRYQSMNERLGARIVGGDLIVYRADAESGVEQRSISLAAEKHWIVDAGFDNFVHAHWDRLLTGDVINFGFALSARLTTIDLQLQAVGVDDLPFPPPPAMRHGFKISVANPLLRVLSAPIFLAYDDERRLLTYYGQSNLSLGSQSPVVAIRYQYPRGE